MNILFVGGGRRLELARLFLNVAPFLHVKIFGYETEKECPLGLVGTIIEGRKWNECWPHLSKVIEDYKIDLVIPLMDKAVQVLAENLCKNAVIPCLETANICSNKRCFEQWMIKNFLSHYPTPLLANTVIEKPVEGFGSRGIRKMSYSEYRAWKHQLEGNYVYQRYIEGKEYSVDCYVNRNGKCIGAVPRLRIEVIGGEVSKSRTVEIPDLQKISMKIVEKMRARGPITLQWIVNENGMWCFEANHRFCGGSPLSVRAGFDTVGMTIDEYFFNKNVKSSNWKSGVYMTRAFESVYYGD